jgi:hypothetical protein
MQESHKDRTSVELRTAYAAGRLSAYFDRSAGTIIRVIPPREGKQSADSKGEEWHH